MATKPTRFAQMGDTTEKVKVYTGIPKQLVVDTSKWKIHLMDGSTPGGFEVAMVRDLQDYATPEVCTQLIYEINEVRRKSTAYQVGDKVDCAFQYERFLECTKAGTTSADLLDTRSVTHGQVITDGTVEWTVRTHVRSINGSVAGADGNVLVDVGAKTVNGNRPDGSGNVNLGLHAVATSGNYNDLSNKPTIPASPDIYVTQSGSSGSNRYRVWSNGFIEQWGLLNGPGTAGGTVTFPKRFSNTTYIFVVTPNEVKASGAVFNWYTENKTTSSITSAIQGSNNSAPKQSWYAAGF